MNNVRQTRLLTKVLNNTADLDRFSLEDDDLLTG